MKKLLRLLLWPFYVLLTQDARLRYSYGKMKGMHCLKLRTGLIHTDLEYDPNRQPERDFMTFKQYMNPEPESVPKCAHESIEYSGPYEEFLVEIGKERMVLKCKKCDETYFNPITLNRIRS